MSETARIILDGTEYEFPVIQGSENEKAIDISKLRAQSGYITLDYGFKNTGSTQSAITYLDGENGILRYRGYAIEDLADKASFLEVAYLLIYGELPNEKQLTYFTDSITHHTLLHENMKRFFEAFPAGAHPMGMLSSMISSLSTFYPESQNPNRSVVDIEKTIHRLIAKLPTLAAQAYKHNTGHPTVYPSNDLGYCGNFLKMMFGLPTQDKEKDKNDSFRLMGFGHRVYKNFDPRAKIIKKAADEVLEQLGIEDPVLDIAKELEQVALNDEYFVARGLYPNVDFYSGIIYRALNIPKDMFTVLFALGRLPGWIAQWKEMVENREPIGRPRQVFTGANHRDFVNLGQRD